MDPGDGTSRANQRITPEGTTSHTDPPLDIPQDRRHTIDVDEVISNTGQSTEDIQPDVKRPRLRHIKRGPRIRNRPEPYWAKLDPAVYGMSEELVQRARIVGEAMREHLRLRSLDDPVAKKVLEEVLSQKTEEAMDPCYSVHFQHVEESKPPSKEYATPNPGNVAHLSELPSQQEQPKLSEVFSCSSNAPVEYCMSDEFIQRLGRQVKSYCETVKPLSQKEIIANGFQHMNEEAFLAFNLYIAEKDPSEGFDYKFGELLHHCFTFEEYGKVYCHYNFTIEMKRKDEDSWTSSRYFAEAKLVRGVKYYFSSPLELTDNGQCHSCTNQGVSELKHPYGGGYEKGHIGSGSHCGLTEFWLGGLLLYKAHVDLRAPDLKISTYMNSARSKLVSVLSSQEALELSTNSVIVGAL